MAPFGRASSELTYGCIAARKRICSTTGTNMGRRRGEEELASQVRDFGCLLRLELGSHDGSFFRDHQFERVGQFTPRVDAAGERPHTGNPSPFQQ
jgi:hypothetical protein